MNMIKFEDFFKMSDPANMKVKFNMYCGNHNKPTWDYLMDIEEIPYFKLMLNSGANCLLEYKSFSAVWDEEMVDCIEGKKVELNDEIYQKYSFLNFGGQKSVPILVKRKLFSYQDYLAFINKDETDRLRDVVNLKNSNPLRYFDNMVKRGYSDVK